MNPKFDYPISVLPDTLTAALQHKIDNKTKPRGALGRLETIALQLGRIQNTLTPDVSQPKMLVFAADHGVVEQGVSPFPQEVTMQMVMNFLAGGAAVSVFCQQHQVDLRIVDVGVKAEFPEHPLLSQRKVAMGTQDLSVTEAMSPEQMAQALDVGRSEVNAAIESGSRILLFGEMGIGNTTTSSCLMAALTGLGPEQCVGPGTGADPAGVAKKAAVIRRALARIRMSDQDTSDIACQFGGFEIVAMAGAMLQSAHRKTAFVVDGFICTVALLLASRWQPAVTEYAIFAHHSEETAHGTLLDLLAAQPLLSLDMRLGEGSGAILALPLIQSAALFLNQMASFESAGVSEES